MSRFDYVQSRRLARTDPSFSSLIMSAIRVANPEEVIALQQAFPAIWEELSARHNSAGGVLPEETSAASGDVRGHPLHGPNGPRRRQSERPFPPPPPPSAPDPDPQTPQDLRDTLVTP